MKRWASVQRQKPTPTADLTKSAGGMFHQEGPMRCGALTRAATRVTRTKKIERETIPANLIRGETVGGTVASGAHRKRAEACDHASAESDPPHHGVSPPIQSTTRPSISESLHETYSK